MAAAAAAVAATTARRLRSRMNAGEKERSKLICVLCELYCLGFEQPH